jgi:hypothetical protein
MRHTVRLSRIDWKTGVTFEETCYVTYTPPLADAFCIAESAESYCEHGRRTTVRPLSSRRCGHLANDLACLLVFTESLK